MENGNRELREVAAGHLLGEEQRRGRDLALGISQRDEPAARMNYYKSRIRSSIRAPKLSSLSSVYVEIRIRRVVASMAE